MCVHLISQVWQTKGYTQRNTLRVRVTREKITLKNRRNGKKQQREGRELKGRHWKTRMERNNRKGKQGKGKRGFRTVGRGTPQRTSLSRPPPSSPSPSPAWTAPAFHGWTPLQRRKVQSTEWRKKKRWERKLINKWTKKKNSPNLSIFQLNGNRLYGEISFLLFPPSKAVVWWCYNISAPHCTNLLPAAPSSSVKRVWRTHY